MGSTGHDSCQWLQKQMSRNSWNFSYHHQMNKQPWVVHCQTAHLDLVPPLIWTCTRHKKPLCKVALTRSPMAMCSGGPKLASNRMDQFCQCCFANFSQPELIAMGERVNATLQRGFLCRVQVQISARTKSKPLPRK